MVSVKVLTYVWPKRTFLTGSKADTCKNFCLTTAEKKSKENTSIYHTILIARKNNCFNEKNETNIRCLIELIHTY